jgi:hypothetical protein
MRPAGGLCWQLGRGGAHSGQLRCLCLCPLCQLRTYLVTLCNYLAVFTHQAVVGLQHPLVCIQQTLMSAEQPPILLVQFP